MNSGRGGGLIIAVAGCALLLAALFGTKAAGAFSTVSDSAGATSSGSNVALGRQMAAGYGWTGGQFDCLNWLWTKESGWNADAANPTSDARGIPQDINGWDDYPPGDPAAQIRWGLGYIKGRYGSPCTAWTHETADNWY